LRLRRHLSYANVTATLALFVAIGGGAYAATKIDSHDIVNGTIKSADLKDHKAVRGLDVRRNGLSGRQISEADLNAQAFAPVAGTEAVDCDPSSTITSTKCASATIKLKRQSRLLTIATGNEESVSGPASAHCELRIDNEAEPLSVDPGENPADNTNGTATNGFARTIVTRDPLSAGRHEVALTCNQLSGDVRIDAPTIAAIAIGSG